jgi:1,4-dihydroxy-2-naphthoate octaprenyltransferase
MGPGLISVAILTVNNLRDIDTDRQSNKRTLVVRFGVKFARLEYLSAILGAALIPVILGLLIENHLAILITPFFTWNQGNQGVGVVEKIVKFNLLIYQFSTTPPP